MPRLTEDQIDDLVEIWHEGTSKQKLHEFLEWTFEDYCLWVSCSCHNPYMEEPAYHRALRKLGQ